MNFPPSSKRDAKLTSFDELCQFTSNQVGIYTMINFFSGLRDGKRESKTMGLHHVNDSICNVIFSEQSTAVMMLGCE